MEKREIGAKNFSYPMPTTLVGAVVNGKPNYLAVAWCSIVNSEPPYISVALNKAHYTNAGIRQNGAFSVNIPSADMVRATDYCGIYSGQKIDKSELFRTFYGKLGNAPLIYQCPLNFECKLLQTVGFIDHEAFIGEIVAVYAEERYLVNGYPDIKKVNPIIFSMPDSNYWTLGESLARAWSIGKKIR